LPGRPNGCLALSWGAVGTGAGEVDWMQLSAVVASEELRVEAAASAGGGGSAGERGLPSSPRGAPACAMCQCAQLHVPGTARAPAGRHRQI